MPAIDAQSHCVRRVFVRKWKVAGQIQGVGFRPFVHRLATGLSLSGTVRNDPAGVTVEAYGFPEQLDEFAHRLCEESPVLAQIESFEQVGDHIVSEGPTTFRIIASVHEPAERGRVTVDSSVCADCLTELHNPSDRRHRHGLINCTNCGPRFTIIRGLPYDRSATTMAGFAMCARCASEYDDPANRRFHAQPTCCPECGPRILLTDAAKRSWIGEPFATAARLLTHGGILAMKGLGGYHLAVRADREKAVQRLRQLKQRDHKPFAVMVADLQQARQLVSLSHEAETLLSSPVAPIILANRRDTGSIAPSVAADSHRLGILLPYTPMQHLLFTDAVLGRVPLVMTSANISDDPLIYDDEEAYGHLSRLCDAFLVHDRPIERAVDDSVLADTARGLVPFRLARGYVPAPNVLPIEVDAPGLCLGGELKNVIGVVRGKSVVLSQHVGDLTHVHAYERFRETIDDFERLFDVQPRWIAADRHPQYLSRRFGKRRAQSLHLKWYEVQHHHAHMASLLAEHGRTDPVIGLICDGTGFGDDGTAWGGEVLVGDLKTYRRAGRLRPLRLPGGDVAAKQTGRCAAAWLFDLMGTAAKDHPLAHRVLPDLDQRAVVFSMLERNLGCPESSGLGRLFDAAAALLSLCDFNHFEAMSGQRLEAAAQQRDADVPSPGLLELQHEKLVGRTNRHGVMRQRSAAGFTRRSTESEWENGSILEFDTRLVLIGLLSRIGRGEPVEWLAWWFHDAVAAGLSEMVHRVSADTGLKTVGLSGGVFCNALLTDLVATRLERFGLNVLTHRRVPPNDGGLAYGQAAIVAARRRSGTHAKWRED